MRFLTGYQFSSFPVRLLTSIYTLAQRAVVEDRGSAYDRTDDLPAEDTADVRAHLVSSEHRVASAQSSPSAFGDSDLRLCKLPLNNRAVRGHLW